MSKKPALVFCIATLILLIAPACSPVQSAGASSTRSKQDTGVQLAPESPDAGQPPRPDQDIPAPATGGAPEGMVAFEGSLFVATTPPLVELWQRAGWRIGDRPIDTESQATPSDCTLYPHAGVPDQSIGACRGYILIPEEGAQHIAVMLTNPDGSTKLVRVSPISIDNQP